MKIKYSVIPFIPAALAMLFFKLMGLVGVDGNGEFDDLKREQHAHAAKSRRRLGYECKRYACCRRGQ